MTEGKGISCSVHPGAVAVRVCERCRRPVCAECACVVGMGGVKKAPLAGGSGGPRDVLCRACAETIVAEEEATRPTAATVPMGFLGGLLGAGLWALAASLSTTKNLWIVGMLQVGVGLAAGNGVRAAARGRRRGWLPLVSLFATAAGLLFHAWRVHSSFTNAAGAPLTLSRFFVGYHQMTGAALALGIAVVLPLIRAKRTIR